MLNLLKKISNRLNAICYTRSSRYKLRYLYSYDRKRFIRHAGSLHHEEKEQKLASVIMAYHVVEKGLSMPERRLGFGHDAVLNLISLIRDYSEKFPQDDQILHAISVLDAYREVHRKENFNLNPDLQQALDSLLADFPPADHGKGHMEMTREQYYAHLESPFCQGQGIFTWLHTGFQGYWFTITLFQMFLIFLALSLLSRLCCTERMLDIGLLLVSSIYFLSFGVTAIREFWDSPLGGILCEYEVTRYFQFFALGIFCRKYWNQFARLLTKDWFKTFFIVIFVMCLCFMNLIENSQISPLAPPNSTKIVGILVRYAGLIVVVSFFFSKERYFNEGNISGNLLEYIGRRTLDIYLLHYFFLPNLKFLQPFLTTGNTVIIQLFIGITVSAAIITLCLLISNVLRSSNFLASWLFGVKPPPK